MDFDRKLDGKLLMSIVASGILSFTGVVIETAMNVTFPSLMKEFSISTALVQWITTGYLLILSVVIPMSGFLKERFPMRKLFLFAASLFMAGTVLGGWGISFPVLLFGRLLQGAGTGIALPLMFNIIMEQAPLSCLGSIMGAGMLVCALAPAVGPSIGGWIVSVFGWRMIFWAVLPLLFLSLLMGGFAIRQSSRLGRPSFDVKGLLLLFFSFTSLLMGCTEMGKGELTLEAALLFLFFMGTLILFGWQENHRQKAGNRPLLNLRAFSHPAFSLGTLGLSLLQLICLAFGFLIPNFAQIARGEDAFSAGCILLPGCLLGALFTPLSGRIYDALGPVKPILTGSMLVILSCLSFLYILPEAGIIMMTLSYILFAAGQGLSVGNILTYNLSSLPEELKADGNGICNTFQQLSGAIGTALAAAILSAGQLAGADLAEGTSEGTIHAFLVLLMLAVVMGLALGRAVWRKSRARVER